MNINELRIEESIIKSDIEKRLTIKLDEELKLIKKEYGALPASIWVSMIDRTTHVDRVTQYEFGGVSVEL